MTNHLDEEQRRDEVIARCKAARLNLTRPHNLNAEVWARVFGEGGFDLEDGWARIFALSKLGVLHVFKRVRLEEEWLGALSLDVASFKALTKWPEGSLPKSNPWKVPYFSRTVVAAPKWSKEHQQWEVVFDCKPSITFWFKDEYIKASGLEGWLVPRKQSATFPWKQGGGVIKEAPPPKVWVPELNNEERKMLLEGNTAQVVRNLHVRHANDLKEKRICVMDIKEGVDRLLEAIE